jgi:hypothetical protein
MTFYPLSSTFLLLLLQAQEKAFWARSGENFLLILAIISGFGVLLGIVYFFWHGKSREELSKANAELKELCDTRGKRIEDLKTIIADRELDIEKLKAVVIKQEKEIAELEADDERNRKIEFRLRAEIADLERRLGITIHETGDQANG